MELSQKRVRPIYTHISIRQREIKMLIKLSAMLNETIFLFRVYYESFHF